MEIGSLFRESVSLECIGNVRGIKMIDRVIGN